MASADCLWRNPATIFVSDLVTAYSALCAWNAMDNSCTFQRSYFISHNVLLPKRSEVSSLLFLCFYVDPKFSTIKKFFF